MRTEIFIFSTEPVSNAKIAESNINAFLHKVKNIITVTQTTDTLNNTIITIIYEPDVNSPSRPNKKIQDKS